MLLRVDGGAARGEANLTLTRVHDAAAACQCDPLHAWSETQKPPSWRHLPELSRCMLTEPLHA